MFLFWWKPKGKRYYDWLNPQANAPANYKFNKEVYGWFALPNTFFTIMWFLCIPFLFMAFSETIGVFKVVTIMVLIFNFLTKITDPDYKYL